MFGSIRKAIADAHTAKTAHSEFWHFTGYAVATAILIKQGFTWQTNWPFVAMFIAYLAIIAASSTAVKLFAMLHGGAQ